MTRKKSKPVLKELSKYYNDYEEFHGEPPEIIRLSKSKYSIYVDYLEGSDLGLKAKLCTYRGVEVIENKGF